MNSHPYAWLAGIAFYLICVVAAGLILDASAKKDEEEDDR